MDGWKTILSFWEGLLSGAMLVLDSFGESTSVLLFESWTNSTDYFDDVRHSNLLRSTTNASWIAPPHSTEWVGFRIPTKQLHQFAMYFNLWVLDGTSIIFGI